MVSSNSVSLLGSEIKSTAFFAYIRRYEKTKTSNKKNSNNFSIERHHSLSEAVQSLGVPAFMQPHLVWKHQRSITPISSSATFSTQTRHIAGSAEAQGNILQIISLSGVYSDRIY
jgi:hypothetical protein